MEEYHINLLKSFPEELINEVNLFKKRERQLANSDAFYYFLNDFWEQIDGNDIEHAVIKKRIEIFNNLLRKFPDLYHGKNPLTLDSNSLLVLNVRMYDIRDNKFVISYSLLAKIIEYYYYKDIYLVPKDRLIIKINRKLESFNNPLRLTFYPIETNIIMKVISINKEFSIYFIN